MYQIVGQDDGAGNGCFSIKGTFEKIWMIGPKLRLGERQQPNRLHSAGEGIGHRRYGHEICGTRQQETTRPLIGIDSRLYG